MKLKMLLILSTFLLLINCSPERAAQRIVFVTLTENLEFKEVHRVPLVVGQPYGWALKVENQDIVVWKEVFTLPSVPKTWGDMQATSNVNVVEKSEQPIKSDMFGEEYFGFVSNMWTVAEGDSAGIYNFKIFQDNELIKEFNIEFYEQ